jgi:hypothetical protein
MSEGFMAAEERRSTPITAASGRMLKKQVSSVSIRVHPWLNRVFPPARHRRSSAFIGGYLL